MNLELNTFREFLNEAPQALMSDWEPDGFGEPYYRSELVTKRDWGNVLGEFKAKGKTLELRKYWIQEAYIMGYFTEEQTQNKFKEVLAISLEKQDDNTMKEISPEFVQVLSE